jgi:hypothetical protein
MIDHPTPEDADELQHQLAGRPARRERNDSFTDQAEDLDALVTRTTMQLVRFGRRKRFRTSCLQRLALFLLILAAAATVGLVLWLTFWQQHAP